LDKGNDLFFICTPPIRLCPRKRCRAGVSTAAIAERIDAGESIEEEEWIAVSHDTRIRCKPNELARLISAWLRA
jgi:hypothetical protein